MGCSECGGETVWDDAAASEICQGCGTLTDANQVVLTSHTYLNDPAYCPTELWDPVAPTTLKSTRTSWALAGQGQEVRDRKNAYTMANFIKSLAISMNAAGLAPRATTLFNQAKSIGFFRWGRRAKLVAGACLAISLRESRRPDSLQDISVLLKCSPSLLSRTFISVTSALQITTKSVEPTVYLATLQAYLTSTIQGEHQVDIGLPAALVKNLQPLSLHAVTHTATSLCHILARLCPSDGMSKPSAASTACAIFLLSLEAEVRTSLNSLGDLGKALGARLGIGKGVVMAQYKSVQDQVASLIEKVPWLGKYKSQNGRAKVAKRTVVARGLKDVIKFNEEIFHNVLLPDIDLQLSRPELEEDKEDAGEGNVQCDEGDASPQSRPPKRRKLHHSLDEASRFLLDPLRTSKSSKGSLKAGSSKITPSSFPMTSYVLSTSSLSNLSAKAPTRLQLLATERGGSDAAAIPDDELFAPGELEAFLRDEKEAALLQKAFGWDESSEEEGDNDSDHPNNKGKRPRKVKDELTQVQPKKSRLNMEAFTQLMKGSRLSDSNTNGNDTDLEEEDSRELLGLETTFEDQDYGDYDYDFQQSSTLYEDEDLSTLNSGGTNSRATYSSASSVHEGEGEIILDWRPPSPSGGGAFGGLDTFYEEEYD
ncbi:hypothetical protein BKA70DRAFT_1088141 [Coprinopsis sp. MPI-PUGE-AT-0042]|nr:hypothetical protein BKA70DRAFT_1088141 [Coprinopsis sp. MPI-PUGE-AT-0042]